MVGTAATAAGPHPAPPPRPQPATPPTALHTLTRFCPATIRRHTNQSLTLSFQGMLTELQDLEQEHLQNMTTYQTIHLNMTTPTLLPRVTIPLCWMLMTSPRATLRSITTKVVHLL